MTPKVVLSHRRIWSMPSVTFDPMSSIWLVSWLPTNDSMPNTIARVPMTVMPAARPRGNTRVRRCVHRLEQGGEQECDQDRDDDLGQPRGHVERRHHRCADDQRAPGPLARRADAAGHGPVGRPVRVVGGHRGLGRGHGHGAGEVGGVGRGPVRAGQAQSHAAMVCPGRSAARAADRRVRVVQGCPGPPDRFRAGCALVLSFLPHRGAVAQLVARLVRNEKARGSNPLSSTT